MAAEILKDFLARLGFQVDEAGAQKFGRSLASASLRAAAFGATLQAAAASLYYGLYRMAEGQSQMLALSEATGVAVGRLEELDYIAGQAGSSSDALHSSLKGLQAAMAGATIGQGGLATFQRLGIQVKDANGHLRDTADVLLDVGQRIKGMDRGKQEMFLSQLGIDRSLVRMLTTDVSGLQAAYREMYAAAGTDAQAAAEAGRTYVNEIKSVQAVLGMLAKSIGMAFVGQATGSLQRLRKGVVEHFGKISRVIQTVISVVGRGAAAFGALTLRLMQWVGGIVEWFGKLDSGTQNLILAVLGFAAAWKYLNLSFLASPLGLIISGLLGLMVVLDDLQTYMEGGESLIDWGPWVGQIMAVVDALRPLMEALGRLWDMLKGPLLEGFRAFGQDVLSILGALLGAVIAFVTAVAKLFSGDLSGALDAVLAIFQRLMDIVNVFASRIGQVLSGAWSAVKGIFGGEDDGRPAAPLLGPSPALAAAAAGSASNATLNANTVINVDGAGSPEATARAVGRQQGRVNADMVRNTRGAAR